ncbi:hypothetical protein H7I53_17710 [Mycolicibacterium pulveris]|uniref:Uncharacterized protein n=1 Tax=Mycolicibacterium pulveris TaxID=36813 RepID=A0A7I7UDD9_MYCPV|nr:hypothetical protein [Mycolicibacterium pulveris]MCV6982054.1 hypothetical protein [Mycolicibacterium pulveris]BBY78943.1 hypothetical protein MPUL_01010 [Mycolicibacterium pulveris]
MAVREIGTSPIVFGQATQLYESISAEFRRHGVVGAGSDDSGPGEAIIAIVDDELINSKRQEKASETHICDLVTDTAIATGVQRLLVVCDVRQTPEHKHRRAADWVRSLAHRIGYECSMNGLQDLVTSIAVVRSDTDAHRISGAVVDWYKGIRPAGGWFGKPDIGADA